MNVTISPIPQHELEEYAADFPTVDLSDRVKVTVSDGKGSAHYYLEQHLLKKLGEIYVKTHSFLHYYESLDLWTASLSQNDWMNDVRNHPPRIYYLTVVEYDHCDCATIYRSGDGTYYARQKASRENFARWLCLGKRKRHFSDGAEVKPNTIFFCENQNEMVKYDDWNGTAAYSSTFNKDFPC